LDEVTAADPARRGWQNCDILFSQPLSGNRGKARQSGRFLLDFSDRGSAVTGIERTERTPKRGGASQLLRRYQVFASKNMDEAQAFMASREFFLDMRRRDAGALDIVSRLAYLPGIFIGCIHYGATAAAGGRPGRQKDDFWVHFPVRGNSEMVSKTRSLPCNPHRSVVIPADGHYLRSAADSERVTLSVSRATAMTQLTALLGELPSRRLEFNPEFDLEAVHARRLRRQVHLAIADLDEVGLEGLGRVMINMYEQLIVTGLLLGQPSNYTAALQGLENKAAPGDVKRAIDFIEAHLRVPISLADIARASGVPGRTLLEHFKNHRSVSPMRYLREARLARVRQALLSANDTATVTDIAMNWGFSHLGRFAAEYRGQYGESPSETFSRSRVGRR
jgi:AraC-like DNA-binding protein